MTIPASAREVGSRLPSRGDQKVANQLRSVLAAHADGDAKLRVVDETRAPVEITLTPALSDLLLELLRHVARGDAVTLVPVSQRLTTQQAADILNVSRPHLISLIEKGAMPYVMVGRHRRIKADDLFAYKRQRDQTRSSALEELAAIDGEHL